MPPKTKPHFAWETRGIKDHHSPFLQTPTPCNSCMLHSLTPHHHRQIHRPRLRGIQCIRQPLNRIHRKGRAVVSLARERVGAHERPFDVGGDVGEDAGVVSTGEEGDDLGYGAGGGVRGVGGGAGCDGGEREGDGEEGGEQCARVHPHCGWGWVFVD